MQTLSAVLDPMSDEVFLREHFEPGTPVYIPGHRDKFGSLITWEEFDQTLSIAGVLRAESVVLRRNGATVPMQQYASPSQRRADRRWQIEGGPLVANLRSGATLILNSAEEVHSKLGILALEVQRRLRRQVWINAYAVWQNSQGSRCHFDPHDVLVLQVQGRKRWQVFGPPMHNPVAEPTPNLSPPESVILDQVLSRGDVLFLPRGFWHMPVPCGEPTLHLTIGVERRTGLNLLQWLTNQLGASAFMRATVPAFGSAERDADYIEQFLSVLSDACRNDPLLLKSFYSPASSRPPGLGLPLAPEGTLELHPSHVLRTVLAYDLDVRPVSDGTWADVVHDGKLYRYHSALIPVLRYLAQRSPCALYDCHNAFREQFDARQIDELVNDMYQYSLVFVAAATL